MYNYNPTYGHTSSQLTNNLAGAAVWTIVAFVLAVIGAFLAYFLFVKADKKLDNKFLIWLKSFLDFQSMLIEPILKIAYIFAALFITLESFALIGTSFVSFLLMITAGNICARVVYEFIMIQISIWQNTRDINKKMK